MGYANWEPCGPRRMHQQRPASRSRLLIEARAATAGRGSKRSRTVGRAVWKTCLVTHRKKCITVPFVEGVHRTDGSTEGLVDTSRRYGGVTRLVVALHATPADGEFTVVGPDANRMVELK